jgi:hypothetical protein
MATIQHQNFGETTVNEALDSSETTVTVTDGSVFPSSGNFAVVVDDEIMHVTARSSNDLTVVRGAESTTAAEHANGANIAQVITAGFMPGVEIDYVEKTSDTSVTGTTEGAATTVVTGNAVTYDGRTPVWIEFFAPFAEADDQYDNDFVNFVLTDGGTVVGRIASHIHHDKSTASTTGSRTPIKTGLRITPSAASHTYDVRAWAASGAATVKGDAAAGAGTWTPAYIRITVA